MHVQTDVPLQGDEAVQQLGDAASVASRVHVRDPLSFQLAREGEDLGERGAADDRTVVGQAFLCDANFFHGNP